MAAERERGLREDTLAVAPVRKLPAREHAAAYLISGVPGAGKSTVARLLALHFDRSAHIDIDMIYHHFTVAGREQPTAMTGDADEQAHLAIVNAAGLARNYVAARFVCVLEGAVAKRSHVLACQQAIAPELFTGASRSVANRGRMAVCAVGWSRGLSAASCPGRGGFTEHRDALSSAHLPAVSQITRSAADPITSAGTMAGLPGTGAVSPHVPGGRSAGGHNDDVRRVVIFGRGGAGKSVLSRQLSDVTSIPAVELDALFWQPGPTPMDPSRWAACQHELVQRGCWILDGDLGPYDKALEVRLRAADTIVILDFAFLRCA